MVLPINGQESVLNNYYIFELRFDHFSHILMFLIWSFIVWIIKDISFKNGILLTFKWIGIGILFAIFAEVIQYFLSYRAFTFRDLFSNLTGIILGISFFFFNSEFIRTKLFHQLHVES